MTQKHLQLPWEVRVGKHAVHVTSREDGDGFFSNVCLVNGRDIAKAKHLTISANYHHRLVEALEGLLLIAKFSGFDLGFDGMDVKTLLSEIKEASK